MAKFKGYRTSFTGVEEFFFHSFHHRFCKLTGMETTDYKFDGFLIVHDEFAETGFNTLYRSGNLSNQLSGKITSAAVVKNFAEHEDMYYNHGNDPWLNLIYSKLGDFDYIAEASEIISGIDAILSKREELVHMQAENLCNGYNSDVLLQLKKEVTYVYNLMGTARKNKSKEYIARILLMVLSYFVANGSTFIHIGKETPLTDYVCSLYQELLPDITRSVEGFDARLTADVCYKGEITKLDDVISSEHNIFIIGEGGAGKSTMMLSAANNISSTGTPCVYIEAKEADNFSPNEPAKNYLILNRILNVFPEWQSTEKSIDPYGAGCKILSEKLGVSIGYVSQVERGITKISLDLLGAISSILECDIASFITESATNTSEYMESELLSEIRKLDGKKKKYILEIIKLTNDIT